MNKLSENLLTRLTQADIVCRDCGARYGKYSVGCSSVWEAECHVCGETKGCTEVRDYGYLQKGINELRGNIKEQSKDVADYMLSVGPIMNDDELEDALLPSYEQGDLTCKFTEAELTALAEVLKAHEEEHPPGWNVDYDSAFEKVMELYGDNCVRYSLSPALSKFHELYGTYGTENEVERAKWEVFRDAFHAGFEYNKEGA
jgi:hypothetical protein